MSDSPRGCFLLEVHFLAETAVDVLPLHVDGSRGRAEGPDLSSLMLSD
jgi:hypothetical protein